MKFTPPVILNEACPLTDLGIVLDEALQSTVRGWQALCQSVGKLPVWDMSFALQHASVVSSSILYDLRGDEVYLTMIGDQCREYIGLQHSKGNLYDLIPKINADDIHARLQACAQHKAPTYCYKNMSWNNGKAHLKYEAIFLPFAEQGSDACSWCFVPKSFVIGDDADL